MTTRLRKGERKTLTDRKDRPLAELQANSQLTIIERKDEYVIPKIANYRIRQKNVAKNSG